MAIVAIDTNVIVRFLTRDDHGQFARAERFIRENEVFIPDTVLLEAVWVLTSAYSFGRPDIAGALRRLLGLPTVFVADAGCIALAITGYERGLDFADAMHLAGSQSLAELATLDREFALRAKGLGRCSVVELPPLP